MESDDEMDDIEFIGEKYQNGANASVDETHTCRICGLTYPDYLMYLNEDKCHLSQPKSPKKYTPVFPTFDDDTEDSDSDINGIDDDSLPSSLSSTESRKTLKVPSNSEETTASCPVSPYNSQVDEPDENDETENEAEVTLCPSQGIAVSSPQALEEHLSRSQENSHTVEAIDDESESGNDENGANNCFNAFNCTLCGAIFLKLSAIRKHFDTHHRTPTNAVQQSSDDTSNICAMENLALCGDKSSASYCPTQESVSSKPSPSLSSSFSPLSTNSSQENSFAYGLNSVSSVPLSNGAPARRRGRPRKKVNNRSFHDQQNGYTCGVTTVPPSNDATREHSRPKTTTNTQRLKSSAKKSAKDVKNDSKKLPKIADWFTNPYPVRCPYYPQKNDVITVFVDAYINFINKLTERSNLVVDEILPPDIAKLKKFTGFVRGIKFYSRNLDAYKYVIEMTVELLESDKNICLWWSSFPVTDYVVLEKYNQPFDWLVDDRFRVLVNMSWWHGKITKVAHDYPQSLYACFDVLYDSKDCESLSPWELFAEDTSRKKGKDNCATPMRDDELALHYYSPEPGEWPECGRDAESDRILSAVTTIESLKVGELFCALNSDTVHKMDLSVFGNRLKHRFYRRIKSVLFDLELVKDTILQCDLSLDAKERASIALEQLELFIITPECSDIMELLNKSSLSSADLEVVENNVFSSPPNKKKKQTTGDANRSPPLPLSSLSSASNIQHEDDIFFSDWSQKCVSFLDEMCAMPFARMFLNINQEEDAPHFFDSFVDLNDIKQRLIGQFYSSPLDFKSDFEKFIRDLRYLYPQMQTLQYKRATEMENFFSERFDQIVFKNGICQQTSNSRPSKFTATIDVVPSTDRRNGYYSNHVSQKSARNESRLRMSSVTSTESQCTDSSDVSCVWRDECIKLIEDACKEEFAQPFIEPVDFNQFPDYGHYIKEPIDLKTIKYRLLANCYSDPDEVQEHFRLLIMNSRFYNSKTTTQIYKVTTQILGR